MQFDIEFEQEKRQKKAQFKEVYNCLDSDEEEDTEGSVFGKEQDLT